MGIGEAAKGIDEAPLITAWEPRSMGRQVSFQHDISGKRVITKALKTVIERVLTDAREEGYRA